MFHLLAVYLQLDVSVSAVPVFQIQWTKECDSRRQPQNPDSHTLILRVPDTDVDSPVMTLTQLGAMTWRWLDTDLPFS